MVGAQMAFAAVCHVDEHGACQLLAEIALTSGNMADITQRILRRLPTASAGSRRSYTYESGYTFHFLSDNATLVFVCMERAIGGAAAFALLSRVQQEWTARYGPGATPDAARAREFEPRLAELIQGGGTQGSALGGCEEEELVAVQERLEQVKTVMTDSIEKVLRSRTYEAPSGEASSMEAMTSPGDSQVLERGERIELLVDKTEQLHQQAPSKLAKHFL